MKRDRIVLRGSGGLAKGLGVALALAVALVLFGRPIFTQPWLAVACFVALTGWAWLTRDRWWNAIAEIGRDGLAFSGRKGTLPEFVKWDEISDVRLVDGRVVVTTFDGPLEPQPVRDAKGFVVRALARLKAYRSRAPADVPHQLVEEDPDEGAYRTAAPPADVLVRVAADPGLDDELRALAAELAVEGGERHAVEELAEDTADPAMRAFLEKLVR